MGRSATKGMMRYGASGVLLLVALLLVLFAISVHRSIGESRTRGIAVVLPLFAGRELDVNIWSRPARMRMRPITQQDAIPLTVTVWYQDTTAANVARLVAFAVPTWPLLVSAGSAGVAAVWLWPRRRRDIRIDGDLSYCYSERKL